MPSCQLHGGRKVPCSWLPKMAAGYGNPRSRLTCLNFLRLEAADSRLQTRVPEPKGKVKGLSLMRRLASSGIGMRFAHSFSFGWYFNSFMTSAAQSRYRCC
jgi:hypothetical protein